jgi:ABC-type Fe3+ transport system permease subunit
MMGLVSLLLILLQAFVIHTWCTLCLCSAVLSLSMVIPVLQEFQAVLHYIKTEKRNGETFWEAVKAN